MKIAIISNVAIESLASRVASTESDRDVYVAPGYNAWMRELINPKSGLWRTAPEAVFIIVDGTELLGQIGIDSRDAAKSIISPLVETIARAAGSHNDVKFFVSSIDVPQKKITPLSCRRIEPFAMQFWREGLEDIGVTLLELAAIAADMGRENFYSARMWYLGSMPFSGAGEKALAREIIRCTGALRGRRKKCLVLDLDNTLWGGIVGEDGVDGIVLSTTKEGARYRDLQARAREIKDCGAILAVVSKNNEDDAMAAIDGHPDMLLRSDDFAAIVANWEPKAANIERLAQKLNIGLDSFVFVDDNPVERQSVALALPQVVIPEFPTDTSRLDEFMRAIAHDYFTSLELTEEDRTKTEQYRAEDERETSKSSFADVGDYLRSLDIKLVFGPLSEHDVLRAAQLTQKTNQFNLTTRRYTEREMAAARASASNKIYLAGLSDKFGDYGKIILAIVRIDGEIATFDTFLMSCRAMGRDVETTFLALIERDLAERGIARIIGEYDATPKNSLVANFWLGAGYSEIARDGASARYEKLAPFGTPTSEAIEICQAY